MRSPRHIVMTVNAAWNIANFRTPLVKALLADGHRITILAPADESVPQLTAMGCEFVELAMDRKGLNPLRDLALFLRIRRHLKALSPDLVLSFTIKNNLFGAFAAKSLEIPFVPNVTGLGTAFLSGGALLAVARTLYKMAFRGLPTIFFQNADDRDLFVQLGLITAAQAQLLPGSGIDLADFPAAPFPEDDGEMRFLMIARILRDKGAYEFVEAARIVKRTRPHIRFQMLGAIGNENRTNIATEVVAGWQAEGVIEYLGTTDDVRPHIAQSHCIVLPSYREGAPRTLIEGAAMARPAIASDVPGCNAVVDHGATGYLCRVKDAGDLAASFQRFSAMGRASQSAMGRNARSKIEREYAVDHVIRAYRTAITK